MRVMVLTDASFAQREHLLLTRLEIGLADEGAAVIHAMPSSCGVEVANAFSSTVVRYDDTPTPLGKSWRARQLLTSAADQLDVDPLRIDVVHVFGRRSWGMAQALALQTGAALVIEVWRADGADAAVRRARAFMRAARRTPMAGIVGRGGVGLLTSSERIADELRRAVGRGGAREGIAVGVAPWGVSTSDAIRPPIEQTGFGAVAVSVVADGDDLGEVRPMLDALHRIARRDPRLLVFLDGAAADRAGVWRTARRMGLLERLTAVAEMEGRREPILQTDILIVPEPTGVCRTLPLAAMADGVALVARPDPYHTDWLNQTTARLVPAATPEAWDETITSALQDHPRTASLRAAARSLVRQQRTVIAYVTGVRRLYDEVARVEVKPATTVGVGGGVGG
jgi:hypothetical protein